MPERILIVRLSAVGDTILNLPVLCALRRHLPDAEIGWVVGRGASQILRGHACLDRLFVLNPEDQKSPGAYLRFARSLRAWGPKVVLDAQGLTKSAGLGWLAGAKMRIGLARSEFEGRELSTWLNTHIVAPQSEHVVDRGLELLRPLGIENPEVEFCVPDSSEHTAAVRESLRSLGLPSRWALLNVGAGWISKLWPVDRYAEVARHLAEKWDLSSVVLWGNAEEKRAAEQVVERSEGTAQLAPATSLTELAAWTRAASLFVGSDTGPMHLSSAVGTPTVGMIGPMPVDRVGPRGLSMVAVQNERLAESERGRRKIDCGPMLSIDAERVCRACDRALKERARTESSAA